MQGKKLEPFQNNVKSTSLLLTLNENLYFELKKIADKKYQTVQDLLRQLAADRVLENQTEIKP